MYVTIYRVLSRFVKGFRFYPSCKLTSESNSFMDAGRRLKIPGSKTKDNLLFTAIAFVPEDQHLCQFSGIHFPEGDMKKVR